MKVKLKRTYFNDATIGQLWIDGKDNPLFHTIERPWLNNRRNESCIPEGIYTVKPYSSQKYPDVYEVCDVTDRSYILFHMGNWVSDLKGCIAPGLSAGYVMNQKTNILEKAVLSSRHALNNLKKELQYPNNFQLEVF